MHEEMFTHPYHQVICKNTEELQYVLAVARRMGKSHGTTYDNWNKFPVNMFLHGDIVGWTDLQDRIGTKYTFLEFVEWGQSNDN